MTSLAEPRASPDLLGHAAAERTLSAAAASGRLHHAWLLLGPPGIGKATLAFRFARALLAGVAGRPPEQGGLDVAPESPVFRRVAAGSHADLLTIERTVNDRTKKLRGEIVVDDVRAVAEFLHLTPAEGGWRVVVLDGAEDLNRNAANALLKTLEEPPPRAVLLLTCEAAGRLLPTFRSRCSRLTLSPLADQDVAALLTRARPDLAPDERARVVGLAEGSIGRALELADEGGVAIATLAARAMDRPDRLTTADALATFDALGRADEAFGTLMGMMRDRLADSVRAAGRAGQTAWHARPLGDWVAAWQALGTLRDLTEGLHLDKREAVVQGFAILAGQQPPEVS